MNRDGKTVDPQLVYLDPVLVDRRRLNAGMSRKKLATEALVAFNTVRELFQGGGVQAHTARVIARALGCDVVDLLAPWDPRYAAPEDGRGLWRGSAEWEVMGYLEQSRLAANGLYYIVCRMRHRHTAGRQGRGKFYHLSWVPAAKQEELRSRLSRHAEVCARVGAHSYLALNLVSTPLAGSEGWWVIDEWVGEKTLAERLRDGPLEAAAAARLLHEVAMGLERLHSRQIVFRELAPSRILIADEDGRAVLTDFELAKLMDGGVSVSSEWPEDPFRAPEVDSGMVEVQADYYSFAKVAIAAFGGDAASDDVAPELFAEVGMPQRLANRLVKCLEPVWERRPMKLEPVMSDLRRWCGKLAG